jgi:hypothetical protein
MSGQIGGGRGFTIGTLHGIVTAVRVVASGRRMGMRRRELNMVWVAMISCVVLASSAFAAEGLTEVYVSPTGDDGKAGTKDKPLASPAGARKAVRQLVAGGLKAPVTVFLAGGTYELGEPLALGPEDSGTEQHAVTWSALPGQTVVLSGGRRVAGWAKGKGEVWETTVPGVKEGKWYFRQMWVDGRRAVRARTPNVGAKSPCLQLKGAELTGDVKTHTYRFPPGALKDWGNLPDVEAVVVGNWEITRKFFQTVDAAAGVAQMAGPHGRPHEAIGPGPGRWFFIENALEALDEPGEWYLDRSTGLLSYWPRAGEDMAKVEVVAPRLTRLLDVKGTADRPVRNLHFRGISFLYADWTPPPGGYLGIQACHFASGAGWDKGPWGRIDAAVRWDYADSCGLEDCTVAHLGGCGIELATRCVRNVIQGNGILDISGNGVMLGGPTAEADVPKDNRIANNDVHSCGLDYYGAVGIWVGFAQRAVIAHNEVHDLPYTGISLGWQWNPKPTPAKENTIEFNHIHDVMTRLGDGGGIYTLGLQPGSVVRGNHIHAVRRSAFAQAAPNNGMFLDEGTTGFTFEGNLIHDTAHTPLRFHQATTNIVRNNILAVGKAGPIEFNAMPAEKITQEDNILVEAGNDLPANTIGEKAGLEEAYRKKLAATQPARP